MPTQNNYIIPYLPAGIGTYLLDYSIVELDALNKINTFKMTNYVVCIDGLAGVGKSTLGKKLSQNLQIPHISSGIFYRIFAYIISSTKIEFTHENIIKLRKSITFNIIDMALVVYFDLVEIESSKLHNQEVDGVLSKYSKDLFFRSQITEILNDMVVNIQEPFILDLRGASPEYVLMLERVGRPVIRLYIHVKLEVKAIRRFEEYEAKNEIGLNIKTIESDIERRDMQDRESIIKTNLSLIHEKSGIIDNSYLTQDQMYLMSLKYILECLTSVKI